MTEDILVRLRQALPGLRPSEQRIARSALADPAAISALGVTELAARNATSTATVARFCRNIGFDGYKSFCLALARAAAADSGRPTRSTSADLRASFRTPADVSSILRILRSIGASIKPG